MNKFCNLSTNGTVVNILLFLLVTITFNTVSAQTAPFKKGFNLAGWFQQSSTGSIHLKKFDKEYFRRIKELGADHLRLPVNLHFMTDGSPDYKPDDLFLNFLDQIVGWTEELDMHLIIDNHTFNVTQNTDTNIAQVLIPVWTQMAEHYKDKYNNIYYEILNEPHGINDEKWNEIQLKVVEAIRLIDTVHTIIVGPAGWNSYNNLKYMPVYEDKNLIYTFHFYDPFIFTHQGAGWTDPSMTPLSDIPFPYDAADMPPFPDELKNSWIESSFNRYGLEGTVQKVHELIDIAIKFRDERNVPLWCGEFGVYMPNSNNEDRVFWHKTVSSYFDSNNIAWSMWEFDDSFGIFEEASNKLFDHDLNVELINALGMNPPPQTEYFKRADTTGFSIFTDYIETDIISSGSASTGILDFYSTDYPYDGSYSVHWTGSDRYNKIGFNFIPDKDLSVLLNKNFAVDFWIKCDVAAARIDIRFVDTKTTNDDKPWRMRYTLDGSALSFNNQWQHLQIPLKEFNEHGAYEDGTWYNAQGLFDWTDVDIFDIVAEYGSLENINFWFDEIKIIDPSAVNVSTGEMFPSEFVLEQNYPNPFNPSTIISYSIPDDDYVTLKVYDILGNEIAVLIDDVIKSGRYKTEFDAQGLSSGIYFYQLYTKDIRLTGKMLLLK